MSYCSLGSDCVPSCSHMLGEDRTSELPPHALDSWCPIILGSYLNDLFHVGVPETSPTASNGFFKPNRISSDRPFTRFSSKRNSIFDRSLLVAYRPSPVFSVSYFVNRALNLGKLSRNISWLRKNSHRACRSDGLNREAEASRMEVSLR